MLLDDSYLSERGYADRLAEIDQLNMGLGLTENEIKSYRAGWTFADIEFRHDTTWPTVVRRHRLFRDDAVVDIARLADSGVPSQVRRQTIKAVTNANIRINALNAIPWLTQMSQRDQHIWIARVRGYGRGFFYGFTDAPTSQIKQDWWMSYYKELAKREPDEDTMTVREYKRAQVLQELRTEYASKFISGFRDGQTAARARMFGEEN